MSVTHKKSEKQIGAAELEALRASIMAEVEAARAETEESIISSIRNNLVSLPEQGEEWNEKKSYITGDVVTLDGVSYTATHYSRGKSPASNPDKWTRTPTEEQIGAIAAAVGVDDMFYFSHLFKKYYGISPKKYREEFLV